MAHKQCIRRDTLHLLIKDCGKGDKIPDYQHYWRCIYRHHYKNVIFVGQVTSGNGEEGFDIIDPHDASYVVLKIKSITLLMQSKDKLKCERNDLIYKNLAANFYLHKNDYIYCIGGAVPQSKFVYAYRLKVIDKVEFDEVYEHILKIYANEYGIPDAIENERNLLEILEQVEAQLCNEPSGPQLKTENDNNENIVTNAIASDLQHSKSSVEERLQGIKKPRYDGVPSTSAIATSNKNGFIPFIEQNDHKTNNKKLKVELDPAIQNKKIDITCAFDEPIPGDLLGISQATEIMDCDFSDFTFQKTQTVACKNETQTVACKNESQTVACKNNPLNNKNEIINHLKTQTENLNQETNINYLFGTIQIKAPENSEPLKKRHWQQMNIFKIQKSAKLFDEVTFTGVILSVEESKYEEDKRCIVVADIQGSISCLILNGVCFSGEPSCAMPGRLNCQFEPSNAKFPHKNHICIGYKVRIFGLVCLQKCLQKRIKVLELRHLNDADAKEFDNDYMSGNKFATEQINDIEVLRSINPFLKTPFRAHIRELRKAESIEIIEKCSSIFGFIFSVVEIIGTVAHITRMDQQECTKCTYQINVNDGTSIITCEFCVEEKLFINQYYCRLPIEDLTFNDTVRVQGLLVHNYGTKCILANVVELLDKAFIKEPNWQGCETYLDEQKFNRYDYFGMKKDEKTRGQKKYEKMSLFNSWNGTIVNKQMNNQNVQKVLHNPTQGTIENDLFSEIAVENGPRQRRNSWSNKTDISPVKKKVSSVYQINYDDDREQLLNECYAEVLKAKNFKGHEKLSSTQMMQLYVFDQSEEMKCNDIPRRHGWRTFWDNFKRDQELVRDTVVRSEERHISDFEVKWKQMLEQLYKEIYLPRINLINSFQSGISNVAVNYNNTNTKEMVCAPKRKSHTGFFLLDFGDYDKMMIRSHIKI